MIHFSTKYVHHHYSSRKNPKSFDNLIPYSISQALDSLLNIWEVTVVKCNSFISRPSPAKLTFRKLSVKPVSIWILAEGLRSSRGEVQSFHVSASGKLTFPLALCKLSNPDFWPLEKIMPNSEEQSSSYCSWPFKVTFTVSSAISQLLSAAGNKSSLKIKSKLVKNKSNEKVVKVKCVKN